MTEQQLWIHEPTIRQWEITSNTTKYEKLVAAPSDEDLQLMWTLWLILTIIVTTISSILLLSILVNKKVKRNGFNLYLLYLTIPDLVFAAPCVIACLLNVIKGSYFSTPACRVQSFYVSFGIGANAWLNGVVAWQLHTMLRNSQNMRRFKAPSRRTVTKHALCVYAWSAFVATWPLTEISWLPFRTRMVSGEACLPLPVSRLSDIFFYAVFFPCFAGIPFIYVLWVGYDILKSGMLPPKGKRRVLVTYFFRLFGVFIIMWLPSLLFVFILNPLVSPWILWGAGSWSHLQAGVSALVCLMKPDIYNAVKQFLTCSYMSSQGMNEDDDNNNGGRGSSSNLRGMQSSTNSYNVSLTIQDPPLSSKLDMISCSSHHQKLGSSIQEGQSQQESDASNIKDETTNNDDAEHLGDNDDKGFDSSSNDGSSNNDDDDEEEKEANQVISTLENGLVGVVDISGEKFNDDIDCSDNVPTEEDCSVWSRE